MATSNLHSASSLAPEPNACPGPRNRRLVENAARKCLSVTEAAGALPSRYDARWALEIAGVVAGAAIESGCRHKRS